MRETALQSWEDEGGAMRTLARKARLPARPPVTRARSHPFGEGQQSRTITQDEQDRLAARGQASRPASIASGRPACKAEHANGAAPAILAPLGRV